jgi:hypothetical protein
MTAADIPASLQWDISHAKRALRGQPLPILRDALRMESQKYRPRKRLLKWLQDEIIGDKFVHMLAEYKAYRETLSKAQLRKLELNCLSVFLRQRYPDNKCLLNRP